MTHFGFFFPQTSYWDVLTAHWYLAPSLAALILLYLCGIFDRNNAPNMYPLFQINPHHHTSTWDKVPHPTFVHQILNGEQNNIQM